LLSCDTITEWLENFDELAIDLTNDSGRRVFMILLGWKSSLYAMDG